MRRSKPQDGGFTLVELMIAAAVLAVLGALAIPSFSGLLYDSMRSNAVNSFVHTVFLARSEAMTRGQTVTICNSTDGASCAKAGTDWNTGWITFVNVDRDEPPVRDDNEPVLMVQAPWSRGRITANRAAFSFRPYVQGLVNGTVVFCDPRGSATARAVIINHAGRPRLSQRDASDRPLSCPAN